MKQQKNKTTTRILKMYSFCELSVHHEIVDVLFCPGQLHLTGYDGHKKRCASGTLKIAFGSQLKKIGNDYENHIRRKKCLRTQITIYIIKLVVVYLLCLMIKANINSFMQSYE